MGLTFNKVTIPEFNESHKRDRVNRVADPFYNSKRWRRLSKFVLSNNPICDICDKDLSMHTDHIEPWQDGGAKYDLENLQAICISCHAKKTAKDVYKRKKK